MFLDVCLDVMRHFWWRLVLIFLFSSLVVVFQLIAVFVFMARFVGTPDIFPLTEFSANLSTLTPINFGFLLFFIGLLAAGTMLIIRMVIVSIMIDYEEKCVSRLVHRLLKKKQLPAALNRKKVSLLLTKDCRFGGRLAYEVANLTYPVGVALFSLPILLYLDPITTFIIILLALMVSTFNLIIHDPTEKIAQDMEVDAKKDAELKAKYSEEIINGSGSLSHKDLKKRFGIIPHHDFMSTYRKRLTIPHIGAFLGALGFAIALAAVGSSFVFQESRDLKPANLVLYIYIVFFSLSQLRTVPKTYLNMRVFSVYFSRAFRVIHGNLRELRSEL